MRLLNLRFKKTKMYMLCSDVSIYIYILYIYIYIHTACSSFMSQVSGNPAPASPRAATGSQVKSSYVDSLLIPCWYVSDLEMPGITRRPAFMFTCWWSRDVSETTRYTPWKINIEATNGSFEDDVLYQWFFLASMWIFQGASLVSMASVLHPLRQIGASWWFERGRRTCVLTRRKQKNTLLPQNSCCKNARSLK